ncbi:MAG: hypothetical protein R2742_03760 [Micropruina glycogenica]
MSASPSPSTQPVTLDALHAEQGRRTRRQARRPTRTAHARAGRQWLNANAIYPRKVKVPTTCGLPLIDPARISAAELQST